MPVATSGNGITYVGKTLGELAPELKVGDVVYLNFTTTSNYNKFIYLNTADLLWRPETSKVITEEMLQSGFHLYGNRYQDGETEQVVITDFRMVLGEADIPFERYGVMPSPDYPSEIEVIEGDISVKNVGKNINIPFTYVSDFVTFDNNTVKINGTIAPIGSQYSTFSLTKKYATANYTNYINIANINNILKAGTYTISIEYLGGAIDNEKILEFVYRLDKSEVTPAPIYSIGKLNIANNVTKISKTFTLEKDTPFCALFGIDRGSEHTANNFEFRVQLEKNDVATEYEPYKETITALDLKGEFVGKLPNGVQDYLTVDNQGNYGIQKKVGKVLLNGSEEWQLTEEISNGKIVFRQKTLFLNANGSSSKGVCSHLPYDNTSYSQNDKIGFYFNDYNWLNFIIWSTTANTLDSFKTWLPENNVTVYYELAEPYYVELGKAPIKTLEGDSTIELLSTLDTNMYCKYIRKNDNLDAFQTKEDMGYYYNKSETDAQINITANAINQNVTSLQTSLDEKGKTLASLEKTVNQKIEDDKATFEVINNKLENGVETVKNTLVTIDIEGVKVAKNTSKVSSLIANNQFAIKDSLGKNLTFIGYDEEEKKSKAEMDNLYVSNYFTAGYHRQEKMRNLKRTGWFYVGGNK